MNAPAESKSALNLTQPIGWQSALLALLACLFRGEPLVFPRELSLISVSTDRDHGSNSRYGCNSAQAGQAD